jgi:urease accessory protein
LKPEIDPTARLLVWFSPAFPIGAFAFSHGLEWAVEMGDIYDRISLQSWLTTLVEQGSGWSDAVLFSQAHRAVAAGKGRVLRDVAELAVEHAWPNDGLAQLRAAVPAPYALSVAAGCAVAGAGLALLPAVTAFMTCFCQNLVSSAVRLAPIGQSDGLAVLAALEPVVAHTATHASRARLDDVGGLAYRSDIASMRHETQTTRLFRS